MLKVLTWVVSNDTRFFDRALTILEEQHGGLKSVGVKMGEEISQVDGGGIMIFSSSSARRQSE